MSEQARIETAIDTTIDNCEVLRARLAKYEDADGNALGVVVPEGWQLVPVEPTPEMQTAGASSIRFDTTTLKKLYTGNGVFRAMLAAAPSAGSQGGDV